MTRRRFWYSFWTIGMMLLTVSCVDIEGPAPEPIAAPDVFSEFRFTTDAMMIKPGETLQTTFVATSAVGSPIPVDVTKVLWQSGDSARVFIDSVGRVTAKAVSTNAVEVIAVYTHGTTTRRASLQVYVTADEVSATSLRMVALDSVRVGYNSNGTVPLPRVRLDLYQGDTRVRTGIKLPVAVPAPYVATYIATGGPDREPIYTIKNNGIRLGKFWVTTSVNLYGTEVHDSVEVTGTYPAMNGDLTFNKDVQGNVTLGGNTRMVQQPCAFTGINNLTTRSLEVVFSDSSAVTDECTPALLPESFRNSFSFLFLLGLSWTEQIGGNLQVPPMSINFRRSATRGVVTWFVRDAVTKERLPFSGQYSSIHVE